MRRSMGMVCYVLAGLLLAAALVVPVIGLIAALVVSAWSAAASGTDAEAALGGNPGTTLGGNPGTTLGGGPGMDAEAALGAGRHDPIGVAFELVVNGVISVLDALGPIPTILVALLTVVVEIGLLVGAVILIVIGRRLRRPSPQPRRALVKR